MGGRLLGTRAPSALATPASASCRDNSSHPGPTQPPSRQLLGPGTRPGAAPAPAAAATTASRGRGHPRPLRLWVGSRAGEAKTTEAASSVPRWTKTHPQGGLEVTAGLLLRKAKVGCPLTLWLGKHPFHPFFYLTSQTFSGSFVTLRIRWVKSADLKLQDVHQLKFIPRV